LRFDRPLKSTVNQFLECFEKTGKQRDRADVLTISLGEKDKERVPPRSWKKALIKKIVKNIKKRFAKIKRKGAQGRIIDAI